MEMETFAISTLSLSSMDPPVSLFPSTDIPVGRYLTKWTPTAPQLVNPLEAHKTVTAPNHLEESLIGSSLQ